MPLLSALPALVELSNYSSNKQQRRLGVAEIILSGNPKKNRYKPFDYLNLAMSMSVGVVA